MVDLRKSTIVVERLSLYTLHDVASCLAAVVGFAPVLAGPGYVTGWVTNVLGFKQRPLGERLMWSVPLSFGVTTMLAVMVGKYGSLAAACWVIWGMGLPAVGMVAVELLRGERIRMSRAGWWRVAGGLMFALFVVGELVDIGIGNKLYMSVTVYDQSLRTAFVDAVVRTGVPPGNPLYWTVSADGIGHAAPMRYYYFWYVVCALVVKVIGVSARAAMIASCAWAGVGLAAVAGLYCKHFLRAPHGGGNIRRRAWITIALLAVTGMDILPVIAQYFQGLPTDPDMEWWSQGQVSSWMDTILWVPHHLAALVCCVLGFLVVWMSARLGSREKVVCGVLAGVGFAASFGLSTYVSAAFGMVMVAWLMWSLGWRKERSRCAVLLGSGLLAVVLLVPFLRELRAAGPDIGGKTALFAPSVRKIIDPSPVADLPGFKQLRAWNCSVEDETTAAVLIVPGYAAELGFFGVVFLIMMVRLKRGRLSGEAEQTALFLASAGLLVASLVRSTVIDTNDFGIRSMLVPQFFLLLLGAQLVGEEMRTARRWVRATIRVCLLVGVAGTIYQAGLLRLYLPVEQRLGREKFVGLAERAMAWRIAFDRMDEVTPKDAVVQYDAEQPSDYFSYAQLINARRQTVNAVPNCATAFGGELAHCGEIKDALAAIYLHGPESKASALEARETCAGLDMDYLVATRWDGIWQRKDDWVWTLPVIVATDDVRVVRCGTQR